MSLILFTVVVIVVLALAIAAIEHLTVFEQRWQNVLKALAIVIAAVVIIQRAGLV